MAEWLANDNNSADKQEVVKTMIMVYLFFTFFILLANVACFASSLVKSLATKISK